MLMATGTVQATRNHTSRNFGLVVMLKALFLIYLFCFSEFNYQLASQFVYRYYLVLWRRLYISLKNAIVAK